MQICFLEEYDFIGPNGIKSLGEPRRDGSLIQQSMYLQPPELWQVRECVGTPAHDLWLRAGWGCSRQLPRSMSAPVHTPVHNPSF